MFLRFVLVFAASLFIASATQAEKTFVFVHGSWVGEWYWQPIISALNIDGSKAIAVSLTGHGKKSAESGPAVTLEDHVNDIVATIVQNDLTDVVLVAHSSGGRSATGAWDLARDRISSLVFIEAVAPYWSTEIAIPADKRALAYLLMSQPEVASSGMMPPPATLTKYKRASLSPQSLKTLYTEVALQNGPLPDTPAIYILGSNSKAGIFRQYAARLKQLRGWEIVRLNSGHDVVYDAPSQLIDILSDLAKN